MKKWGGGIPKQNCRVFLRRVTFKDAAFSGLYSVSHSSSTLCRLVVTTAQGKILGNILTTSTGVQVQALDEYSKFLPWLANGKILNTLRGFEG
jgi:hypothetical protein